MRILSLIFKREERKCKDLILNRKGNTIVKIWGEKLECIHITKYHSSL